MDQETIIIKKKIYKFNKKEKQDIIKRILKENKHLLYTYYDYNDHLDQEDIFKIITDQEGLIDVENSISENNFKYINDQITDLINKELTDQELTDQDLKDDLFNELSINWNTNLKDLLKNSYAYLRVDLNTNYEFMDIPNFKKTEYYHDIKKVFKGIFKIKDLDQEIKSFIGSDYGIFTIYFKVSGSDILNLRNDVLNEGIINFSGGHGCGFFNSWVGCGGYLDLKLNKPISLNIKNWINDTKRKGSQHYNLNLCLDNKKYGIQEVYNMDLNAFKDY